MAGLQFEFMTTNAPTDIFLKSHDITARGATNVDEHAAITFLTVPEPASLALLGIGMTGFLAFRRFFKRSSAA
jgi:hypothetical protein